MTKPTSKPLWTNETAENRQEPDAIRKKIGFCAEKLPYQHFNWLVWIIGQWLDFFENVLKIGNNSFIGENGNIGIGTADAFAGKLHVNKNNAGDIGGDIWITNMSGNINGNKAAISFSIDGSNDPVPNARLIAFLKGDCKADLVFLNFDGSGCNEKMRLTYDGKLGIGITNPSESLEVNGRIKDKSGYVMPVGSILAFAGSICPFGWFFCNGAAVGRNDYADLFAVIGTIYGSGDGSTTFNIPDMRETYAVGIGTRGSGVTAHDIFGLGEFKDDRIQGHWHEIKSNANNLGNSMGTSGTDNPLYFSHPDSLQALSEYFIAKSSITDNSNGTPRTGTTTRGKGLGLNYIMKY